MILYVQRRHLRPLTSGDPPFDATLNTISRNTSLLPTSVELPTVLSININYIMDFTVISHILHTDFWRESQITSQTHAITRMAPRFVKVPNSAVAKDAWAELACSISWAWLD